MFRLEHARAGEAYIGRLLPISESPEKLILLNVKFPAGLSLVCDIKSGTISGLVSEPGEFDLIVKYSRRGVKPVREEQGIATLLVVPNPKLMWKDIPSPRNAPYWTPDEKHSLVSAAGFTAVAASKRGRSHAHAGTFRDDDYAIASDGVWLIAVVADGAGSAKYSRMGAKLACEVSSHYLLEQLSQLDNNIFASSLNAGLNPEEIKKIFVPLIKAGLQCAFEEIKNECKRLRDGTEIREFATTTLMVITRKIASQTIVVTYSVGDGAIAIHQKNISVNLLSCGDSGDYAGQTRFLDDNALTLEEVERRSNVSFAPSTASLLLMSDGVSDPFFETDNELLTISPWDTLWGNLASEKAISGEGSDIRLLKWLDFWSKGNHDDRTIIIITQD